MATGFIAQDTAGWGERLRLTHVESGKTFVRQPYMNEQQFRAGVSEFLTPYVGLDIYLCPRAYHATGDVPSSVEKCSAGIALVA